MNNIIKIKSKNFYEEISNGNIKLKGSINILYKILFWIFLLFIIGYLLTNIDLSFSKYGAKIFTNNIINFLKFKTISNYFENQSLFTLSIKLLWTSIKITFVGTLFGAITAFITSYFGNTKINSIYVYLPLKIIIITLRILPEIIFIYIFSSSSDKMLALFFIFWWFTWIWLHEYFSQILENVNITINFQLIRNSKNKFKSFMINIWPLVNKKFISYVFYSFESNIRWSTILSNLGFIGIGSLLNLPIINNKYFNELAIPLLILILFIISINLLKKIIINYFFNNNINSEKNSKIVFVSRNKWINYNMNKKLSYSDFNSNKKIKLAVKIFIYLLTLILTILSLSQLANQKLYKLNSNNFLHSLLLPNWNIVNKNSIYKEIIEFISLIFITLIVIKFLVYVKVFLESKKINKFNTIFNLKNAFSRHIPILTLFIFISPLFNSPQIAFLISFSIHSSDIISNNLVKSVNKIEEYKINNLIKQGWTKLKIYNNFIIPTIKKDNLSFASFEVEKITKNYITYGSFTSSLLGSNAFITREKEYDDITPYIWISIFIVILINSLNYVFRNINYSSRSFS